MRTARIEVYRECEYAEFFFGRVEVGDGDWRWRLRASNGRIIAQSSESYRRTRDVVHTLELTWPASRVVASSMIGGKVRWRLSLAGYISIPITVPDGVSLASRRRP